MSHRNKFSETELYNIELSLPNVKKKQFWKIILRNSKDCTNEYNISGRLNNQMDKLIRAFFKGKEMKFMPLLNWIKIFNRQIAPFFDYYRKSREEDSGKRHWRWLLGKACKKIQRST